MADYDELIRNSIEFIEGRLTEKLDVDAAARQTHFSRHYYQKLFSALIGEPMMEYVKKRRLSLAARDLAQTDVSVIVIALKYGYDSAEGFSRAFKAYHGLTPTQCRKYRLFQTFDKKTLAAEEAFMPSVMNTQRSNVLAKETARKLAGNADELTALLTSFCKQAADAADFAVRCEKESGVPGGVFTQVAQITRDLADKTDTYARSTRDTLRDIKEGRMDTSFAALMGQALATVKMLDDVTFQLNVTTFYLHLNIARTQEQYRDKLMPIGDAYLSLISGLGVQKQSMIETTQAFLSQAIGEIEQETAQWSASIRARLDEIAGDIASVAAFLRDEAKKTGAFGGSFLVISDEIDAIGTELRSRALDVSAEQDLDIPGMLEDHELRVNLLAYLCVLEMCRKPDEKGLTGAVAQIPALAEKVNKAANDIRSMLEEIAQLNTLARKSGSLSDAYTLAKSMDDLLFQARILHMTMKTEQEKFKWAVPQEQADLFAGFIGRSEQALSAIRELHLNDVGEPEVRRSLEELGNALTVLHDDISAAAKDLGAHGSAFACIAKEYGYFAQRMKNAAAAM